MKYTMISPDGKEEAHVEGNAICRGGIGSEGQAQPEVCNQEKPEILKLIVETLWHQGWQIKAEE